MHACIYHDASSMHHELPSVKRADSFAGLFSLWAKNDVGDMSRFFFCGGDNSADNSRNVRNCLLVEGKTNARLNANSEMSEIVGNCPEIVQKCRKLSRNVGRLFFLLRGFRAPFCERTFPQTKSPFHIRQITVERYNLTTTSTTRTCNLCHREYSSTQSTICYSTRNSYKLYIVMPAATSSAIRRQLQHMKT